jgi:hypothetical protein
VLIVAAKIRQDAVAANVTAIFDTITYLTIEGDDDEEASDNLKQK